MKRYSLQNTVKRIKENKELNVVFFGGSVTWGTAASDESKTSWRALTVKWLKEEYPDCVINGVNAAIGGTGTGYGFLRFDRDVTPHNPDLIFIEFSVNDCYQGYSVDESLIYYESIIRKVYALNPTTDIVMIFITDMDKATYSKIFNAHRRLAEYYNIPVVEFGKKLHNYIEKTGEPINNYLSDWVHPNDKGYEFYFSVMKNFLVSELNVSFGDLIDHSITKSFGNVVLCGETGIIDTDDIETKSINGFIKEKNSWNPNGYVYTSYNKGDIWEFEFTGTYLGVLGQSWKDEEASDEVECIIDGEYQKICSFRKNDHSSLHRTFAMGLENKKHKAVLRNLKDGKCTIESFFVIK